MLETDLPFCDGLRKQAGWNQTQGDWERFLRLSPQGCFVAERDGAVVGTVTTVSYGRELGWIGMLLVDAGSRRQGIGAVLLRTALDYFREVKVRCVKLDATPEGEGLYRKLGFKNEWGLTRFGAGKVGEVGGDGESRGVREFRREDLLAVVELDANAFGVARAELMESLCISAKRVVVVERAGKVEGFGLLRRGVNADYLGPIVAGSVESAAAVARAVMGGEKAKFWDVPSSNLGAVRLTEEMGFVRKRALVRMFLGEANRAGIAASYFGIADPALG